MRTGWLGCFARVERRRRPPRRGASPRPRSAAASRRRTGSPRGSATGTRRGRRRTGRSARRARRRRPAFVAQRGQAVDDAPAEPDASPSMPEVAAEDARQHEHRRPLRAAACRPRCVRARRASPRPSPCPPTRAARSCGSRAARRRSAPSTIALGGALVAEVVEVRDLAALVEHERRARSRAACRRTSTASARRDRCRSSRTRRRAASSATTSTESPSRSPATTRRSPAIGCVALVQPLHERAVGHLRGEAGDRRRDRRASRDLAEEVDELRQRPGRRQLERPLEDREVGVEPLRGEQRAARRDTRRARCARPGSCVLGDARRARASSARCSRVVFAVERLERPAGVAAADAREHLGHQPAARMRQQVHVARSAAAP